MEEKPKIKTSPDEAPTRAITVTLPEKQQITTTASGLRTGGIQGNQSLVMQLQQAAQLHSITGGGVTSSPGNKHLNCILQIFHYRVQTGPGKPRKPC